MKCPRCRLDNPDNTRFCGHCGQALAGEGDESPTKTFKTPTRGLERGTKFAQKFEIIEEIGEGGMGTVYKAYDTSIKDVVAIKLLKPEIASDPDIITRFRNEIKLARTVAHRHVCRMYDLNEEGLSAYIAMEYVAGEDLKSFIRRSGHLNEAKALNLAKQILEGLAEAHRLGVIHRDLKPQNIMIDQEGNAKIMDFGIARSLHTRSETGTGIIIGTPEYMSPEQADSRDVDHQTDLYALGVILYEMVTGRVPFEGDTPLSIVLKHKGDPVPNPKGFNTQVTPEFSRVILRCLEKTKSRRYQKAEEIREDLDRIEKGLPIIHRTRAHRKPITTREFTVKFNLKKILVPGLALAALIIAGFLLPKLLSTKGSSETGGPAGAEDATNTKMVLSKETSSSAERPARGGKVSPKTKVDWTAFLKEASKYLPPEEVDNLNRMFPQIKSRIDSDQSLSPLWSGVQSRIQEWKERVETGDPQESQKSYTKSVSEMQKVLNLVNEKERADSAKEHMAASKKKAEEAVLSDGQNLLSWIAGIKEKDAEEAYQKDDFASARILYSILDKVYLLSVHGGDEDQCLGYLQGLVTTVRSEAEFAKAPAKESWLYTKAVEEEERAQQSFDNSQYAESAELFILSAFLYEKARDVALESAQIEQRLPR